MPESPGAAVVLLAVTMLFWANWPLLREFCAVPMPSFALLNMGSQLATSIFLAVTVGNSCLGNSASALDYLQRLLSAPDARSLAVFAGGFLLGHGDHLGSLAMQFIPPGVAYPLYAGVALVCGTCLNAAQVGLGSQPLLLAFGLLLILAGLVCLALGEEAGSRSNSQAQDTIPQSVSLQLPPSVPQEAALPLHNDSQRSAPQTGSKSISSRAAMLLCLLAGLASGGWSPLSTFGMADHSDANPISNAYVVACVFALGQICAYPSVAYLGVRIGDASLADAFRALTPRRLVFGCLCGFVVNSGYVMYFLASTLISPTIAFAMAACNPVLSLAIASLRCQFRDASRKRLILLGSSAFLYTVAIVALASAK